MRKMEVILEGRVFEIELDSGSDCRSTLRVHVNGTAVQVLVPNLDGQIDDLHWLAIDGRPYELRVDPNLHWIQDPSGLYELQVREAASRNPAPAGKPGPVKAPSPGQITRLLVSAGERVEMGQPLLVLEAMKMQNEIFAQATGVVQAVHVTAGNNVKRGDILVEISSARKG